MTSSVSICNRVSLESSQRGIDFYCLLTVGIYDCRLQHLGPKVKKI